MWSSRALEQWRCEAVEQRTREQMHGRRIRTDAWCVEQSGAGAQQASATPAPTSPGRYKNESGQSKGDALLGFIKPESVALAVTLRDGYELRPGRPMTVVPAKFEQRGGALAQKRLGKEANQQRKRAKLVPPARQSAPS